MSKICPVCDFVIQEEGQTSVEEIINSLEQVILEAKGLPEPAFKQSLSKMFSFVMPLITLMAVVLALVSGGLIFWVIAGAAGVYSYINISRRIKSKNNVDKLKSLLNEFDYYKGIAVRNFGKNPEVSKLVTKLSGDIYDIERTHKSAAKKISFIWMIVIIVILLLGGSSIAVSVSVPTEEDKKVEQMVESGVKEEAAEAWVKMVEDYVKAGYDEISGEEARLNIVKEIAKSDIEAAEKFFKEYCQDKMGDLDCALEIVKAYKNVSAERAQKFVEEVKLRYKSDINKLKKQL
ncbi:MAG: hypothetical protein Q4B21_02145 [Bacteroidia bacterium]|nr:hypothetical protein [Bacteroidia bacterium]